MFETFCSFLSEYARDYRLLQTAMALGFFIVLERFFSLRESPIRRKGWFQDLLYVLLNPIFIKHGVIGVLLVLGLGPALQALIPAGFRHLVGNLSYWMALPLAVIVSDLGFYTAHRIFHAVPWLWRFHSVHHSSEHLDALAAVRVHPVDQITSSVFTILPLYTLGFSAPVAGTAAFIYFVQSFYVHSNLRGTWGPFRLVLATPEFHHWHHSDHREAYDKNFAGQLPIWDLIFGTLHLPRNQWPSKYGLSKPLPESFFLQLAYPFFPSMRHGESKEAAEENELAPTPQNSQSEPEVAPLDLKGSTAVLDGEMEFVKAEIPVNAGLNRP